MHRLDLLLRSALTLSLAAAGCSRPRIGPNTKTSPPSDRGEVALQFLLDPAAPVPRLDDDQEFLPPQVVRAELVLPSFPAEALAARAAPAHVVVRVIIDEEGRIAEVSDSPVLASSEGPFTSVYRDAVLRALRHWRFLPGRIQQWEEGKDQDGDGVPDSRQILRADVVRVFYDIRFDFEIVDGEGRVKTSASQGS